ncbi:MAG: PP2C family protein-serine/threonine phosphatase [Planctomycetota bacterium]
MAISRLKAIAAELKQEKETEVAMKVARKRQLSMLPATPSIPGYDFHTKYLPASKVSGDFYEFIPVSDSAIGIAMGDVTGHGVEAGLVMGMAMAAIGIMGTGVESPKDILAAVNNYLAPKLDGETFFSASYGILDFHLHTFRFARAGHNPPILYNPRRNPALTQLSPPGMVIGVDKTGKRFPKIMEEITIQLAAGDLFVQYTDGVTEAPNKRKEEYGEDRLMQIVARNYSLDIANFLTAIEEDVLTFCGDHEQEDDITLIGFRVHG